MPLILLLGITVPAGAQAPPPHHAGLLIVDDAGQTTTHCVAFDTEPITGLELLEQAERTPVFATGGTGAALCALDGVGCAADDCFCQCKGNPCTYWSYFHLDADGTWAYSGVGASGRLLRDGAVDAWVWGDGATPPPEMSFAEICPLPAEDVLPAPATLAPESIATPIPTPTPILAPASTTTAPPATGFPSWITYSVFLLLLAGVGSSYVLLRKRIA